MRWVQFQIKRHSPGLRPCFRVIDSRFVVKNVLRGPCEPFREYEIIAWESSSIGSVRSDGGAAIEVRRLYDQRAAFPMANRVAHVRNDCLWRMAASIESNDSGFVNHFAADEDDAGRLNDFVAHAVGTIRSRCRPQRSHTAT